MKNDQATDRLWNLPVRARPVSAVALLLILYPLESKAGLMGTTVAISYRFPDLFSVRDARSYLVAPGIEVDCGVPPPPSSSFCGVISTPFAIDIDDFRISFQYGNGLPAAYGGPVDFNGFVFEGLSPGAPITSVTLTTNGFTGLGPEDVSFTANSVRIDLQGATEVPGASWSIAIDTSPVPEPASGTLAALSTGCCLAWLLRSRRRVTNTQ